MIIFKVLYFFLRRSMLSLYVLGNNADADESISSWPSLFAKLSVLGNGKMPTFRFIRNH